MKHKHFPHMRELGERGFTDWMEPDEKGFFYIACCDCGLVHKYQFRIEDQVPRVKFRARQAPRYTARQRKGRK